MRNWKEYFNNWLLTPLVVNSEASAKEVLKVLSCHPIFDDETAKDYFVHPERANERMGKFRIWGEIQDTFYCFLHSGTENGSKSNLRKRSM